MKTALRLLMLLAALGFVAVASVASCGVNFNWAPVACGYFKTQIGVSTELRNAALVVLGMLATTTWVIGQLLSHLRARQQHTINLIVMRLTNDTLVADIDYVEAKLPHDQLISGRAAVLYALGRVDELSDSERQLLQRVKRIANYYEFLSEAYYRRTVDREVLESTLGGSFVEFYRRVWPYILAAQKRYDADELNVTPDKPRKGRAFERYHDVMTGWGAPLADIERGRA